MKFTTSQEIAVPAAVVFAKITDFETLERAALRRDAAVVRRDSLPAAGVGSAWEVDFQHRGKARNLVVEIQSMKPSDLLSVLGTIGGFEMTLTMTPQDIGAGRSRLGTALEVKPRSLSARFLLNSMRFGKKGLERRFDRRIAELCRGIERWHRTGANPWQ
ncbi:SRPBCC family protein [Albidovulum sediminicola]|uniref:SRPBCC family protein n=1 Tax=Albidovulum sediminicola TaxID=2984331 RepID=A0ABT2YX42_9RHOB|nr:SRPBCC family protein [Defluviimonas sp. WL0075]MCV2863439.1 SRPBCC family protein [Defluviimonas sp. WL0075]